MSSAQPIILLFVLIQTTMLSYLDDICKEKSSQPVLFEIFKTGDYLTVIKKFTTTYYINIVNKLDEHLDANKSVFIQFDSCQSISESKPKNCRFLIKIYKRSHEEGYFKEYEDRRKFPEYQNTGKVGLLNLSYCLSDENYNYVLFNNGEQVVPLTHPDALEKVRKTGANTKYYYMWLLLAIYQELKKYSMVHINFDIDSMFFSDNYKRLYIGNFNYLKPINVKLEKESFGSLIRTMIYLEYDFVSLFNEISSSSSDKNFIGISTNSLPYDNNELHNFIKSNCKLDRDSIEQKFRAALVMNDKNKVMSVTKIFVELINEDNLKLKDAKYIAIKDEFLCTPLQRLYLDVLKDLLVKEKINAIIITDMIKARRPAINTNPISRSSSRISEESASSRQNSIKMRF